MKYKVNVAFTLERTYTLEVDAPSWRKAESMAIDQAMDGLQVDCTHITDTSVDFEQQTQNCEGCGKEYAIPTSDAPEAPLAWTEDYEYCAECGAKMEREDAEQTRKETVR